MKAMQYKSSKEKVDGNYQAYNFYKDLSYGWLYIAHSYQAGCAVTVYFGSNLVSTPYDTLFNQLMREGFKRNKDSSDVEFNIYFSAAHPNYKMTEPTTQNEHGTHCLWLSYYPTGKPCQIVYDW